MSRFHFGRTFATLLRTAERGHTKDLRKSMCSDVKKEAVQHMQHMSIVRFVSVHGIIEGSLEVKLPTIWTVEKQR